MVIWWKYVPGPGKVIFYYCVMQELRSEFETGKLWLPISKCALIDLLKQKVTEIPIFLEKLASCAVLSNYAPDWVKEAG